MRYCVHPGCRTKVKRGRCAEHQLAHSRNDAVARGTARERGYDSEWETVRGRYVATHPHCESCLARGVVRKTDEVDHVVPFRGLDDPLRLDPRNLRALCHPCHVSKTWRDRKHGGMPSHAGGTGEGGSRPRGPHAGDRTPVFAGSVRVRPAFT